MAESKVQISVVFAEGKVYRTKGTLYPGFSVLELVKEISETEVALNLKDLADYDFTAKIDKESVDEYHIMNSPQFIKHIKIKTQMPYPFEEDE